MADIDETKFSSICRICLNNKKLSPISLEITNTIEECINVKILLQDGMPNSMCTECKKLVNKILLFKRMCENSNKVLSDLKNKRDEVQIENIYIKTEHIEETSEKVEQMPEKIDDLPENIKNDLPDNIKEDVSENNDSSDNNENDNLSDNIEDDLSDNTDEDYVPEKKKTNTNKRLSLLKIKLKKTSRRKYSKRVSCERCGKRFNESTISKHMRRHQILKDDGKTQHKCYKCEKIYYDVKELRKHQKTHKPYLPYGCKHCGRAYISDSKLQRHLRGHHNCSQCDKECSNRSELRAHVKLFHPAVPKPRFVCPVCGVSLRNLRLHTKRCHGPDHHVKCEICSSTFSSRNDLIKHKVSDHGESRKPARALCSTCGKVCGSMSELQYHMLGHTGVKPHACHLCDKRYTASKSLKCHLRTHSGEKPYACSVCDRRFHNNEVMKQHLRVHTGERPYVCPFCGKTFAQSSSLHNHKKTH